MRMGIEIATILKGSTSTISTPRNWLFLVANVEETIRHCKGSVPEQIVNSWSTDLTAFDAVRRKYFLYK